MSAEQAEEMRDGHLAPAHAILNDVFARPLPANVELDTRVPPAKP